MGPIAIPSPMVPAQAPIARARSAGSRKTSLMIDKRRWDRQCRTNAHDSPPPDQQAHRAREGGADRCSGKHGQADEEEALAAESIGQAAADEQQPCEDHRVGVDNPLQLARVGAVAVARVWAEPR